jgi:hypothetical protein
MRGCSHLMKPRSQKVMYVDIPGKDDGSYHAEMQLLSYLLKNPGLLPDPPYFGVSKPCCQFCRGRLDAAGIGYALGHQIRTPDKDDPNTRHYPKEPHMDPERFCRKICSGGHEGAVASVYVEMMRPKRRTVRLQYAPPLLPSAVS